MSLSAFKLKKLTAAIGTCLVLGASGPMLADTNLEVVNDGLMLSAFVGSSSGDILSTSIRIVGPDGFTIEKRVEGGSIDWIPEDGLADGVYHWEAWAVMLKPGAEPRPVAQNQHPELSDQSDGQRRNESSSELIPDEVPLERFFHNRDKNVIQKSGSFRVEDGWFEQIDDGHGDTLSGMNEPNRFQQFAGRVLDMLVPSAYAEELFTENVRIQTGVPRLYLESPTFTPGEWNIAVGDGSGDFFLKDRSTSFLGAVLRIEQDAPSNSLRIRDNGNVGLGTSAPTNPLHIRTTEGTAASIRLDNVQDSQSWDIHTFNAGRFEIRDSGSNEVGAFAIEPGAPGAALYVRSNGNIGIGTDTPLSFSGASPTLDIQGSFVGLRLGSFGWTNSPFSSFFRGGNNQGIVQIRSQAPAASLSINDDGNVGLGTVSPQAPLHIRRADGSAQALVQDTSGSNVDLLTLKSSGAPLFRLLANDGDRSWEFRTTAGGTQFAIATPNAPGIEFRLSAGGNAQFLGDVTANGVLLTSARETKTDFAPLDVQDILDRLSQLEISEWRYKHEPESAVHFGPVAEEFHEVFGLGNGTHLNVIDTNGIAFAAIQALNEQNRILKQQNSELTHRIERLEFALN